MNNKLYNGVANKDGYIVVNWLGQQGSGYRMGNLPGLRGCHDRIRCYTVRL